MINDTIRATGHLLIEIFNSEGDLKDSRDIDNLIVSVGKTFIAARLIGSPAAMSNMALGSGVVAAVIGDIALGAELGRVVLASATSAASVATYVASFPAGTATGAVTEAGILNAGAGGTMLARTVFPVVNKGAGDTMSITWNVTIN
jgi:hypothetical protein